MDDLSVAMETGFRLQDVQALEEVDSESLPQEESLRKALEGLSVRYGYLKSKLFLPLYFFLNKITTMITLNCTNRYFTSI